MPAMNKPELIGLWRKLFGNLWKNEHVGGPLILTAGAWVWKDSRSALAEPALTSPGQARRDLSLDLIIAPRFTQKPLQVFVAFLVVFTDTDLQKHFTDLRQASRLLSC